MSNKLIKSLLISFSLFAVVPALAFAQTGTGTVATTTPPTATSSTITCMQNSLDKRETALITAHDAFNESVKTALQARLSGLKTSWTISDRKQRIEKRLSTYKTFRTDVQTAHNTLRNTKNTVWKNFQNDAKACGIKGTGELPTMFQSQNSSL